MNFSELNKICTICILALLAMSLVLSTSNGSILIYLHPRTLPFIKIASVVLFLLSLYNLRVFTRPTTDTRLNWKMIMLLLPLAAAAFVKPYGPSSRMARQKGLLPITIVSRTADPSTPLESSVTVPAPSVRDTITAITDSHTVVLVPSGTISHPDTIADSIMVPYIDNIYADPTHNVGKRIVMTGFIALDTVLGHNSFFLGRMMVSCCAADAMSIGFYCLNDSLPALQEGDWVKITGTLKKRTFKLPWDDQMRTLPVLKTEQIEQTTAPQMPYIYPMMY